MKNVIFSFAAGSQIPRTFAVNSFGVHSDWHSITDLAKIFETTPEAIWKAYKQFAFDETNSPNWLGLSWRYGVWSSNDIEIHDVWDAKTGKAADVGAVLEKILIPTGWGCIQMVESLRLASSLCSALQWDHPTYPHVVDDLRGNYIYGALIDIGTYANLEYAVSQISNRSDILEVELDGVDGQSALHLRAKYNSTLTKLGFGIEVVVKMRLRLGKLEVMSIETH